MIESNVPAAYEYIVQYCLIYNAPYKTVDTAALPLFHVFHLIIDVLLLKQIDVSNHKP